MLNSRALNSRALNSRSSTAIFVFEVAVANGGDFALASLSAFAGRAEASAAAESSSIALLTSGAISNPSAPLDSSTATGQNLRTVTESIFISTQENSLVSRFANIANDATATAIQETGIFSGVSEPVSASHSQGSFASLISTSVETSNLTAAEIAAVVFLSLRNESGSVVDSTAGTVSSGRSSVEPLSVGDFLTGLTLFVSAANESVVSGESETAGADFIASRTESSAISEVQSPSVTALVAHESQANPDEQTTGLKVHNSLLGETSLSLESSASSLDHMIQMIESSILTILETGFTNQETEVTEISEALGAEYAEVSFNTIISELQNAEQFTTEQWSVLSEVEELANAADFQSMLLELFAALVDNGISVELARATVFRTVVAALCLGPDGRLTFKTEATPEDRKLFINADGKLYARTAQVVDDSLVNVNASGQWSAR